MRIGPAANVARLNVAEVISALWSFSHANGLLTDDINERTAAGGVTIDGIVVKDSRVDHPAMPATGSIIDLSGVTGDSVSRRVVRADGRIEWGPGNDVLDINLYRAADDELATDDDFNVGGVLDLASDIELAESDINLSVGANNNVATGTMPVHRLIVTGGAATITGFAGGRNGRLMFLNNTGPNDITFKHLDAGSSAVNRIETPNFADMVLRQGDGCILRYTLTGTQWSVVGFTN